MNREPTRLASLDNPRVKEAVRLRRRKARDESGRFVVEGRREIERALAGGVRLLALYLEESAADDGARIRWAARAAAERASFDRVTRPVFEKMAMREDVDGLLAVFATPPSDPARWPVDAGGLVVAAVDLEKPGNLGALARSADAFGANGLLAAGGTDLWNPNTVRASVGSIFALPTAAVPVGEVVPVLRARGLRLVAATPAGEAALPDADLTGGVALLFGSEEHGLPREILDAADVRVAIPMRGAADSLNVSVTAGILLYEASRQRRAASPDASDR